MSKPDFFLVGAPKCGTTAMCSYLAQHPELYISPIKEPNYFGRDVGGPRAAQNIDEYLDLFREAGGKKCGEGSVWYLFSETAAKEIYSFNPNAKIIIMLRNPVDVIHSLHSQFIYDGNHEDIEDLEKAIQAEADRMQGLRIPKTCSRPEGLIYTNVIKFSEQVQRYTNIFPPKNVQIIIYDDFKSSTFEVYKTTLNFLGVNSKFIPKIKVVNANKRARSKALKSFLVEKPRVVLLLKPLVPDQIRASLKKALKAINTQHEQRQPLKPELRKRLQEEFTPEVEKLSKLLRRDLTYWSTN